MLEPKDARRLSAALIRIANPPTINNVGTFNGVSLMRFKCPVFFHPKHWPRYVWDICLAEHLPLPWRHKQ